MGVRPTNFWKGGERIYPRSDKFLSAPHRGFLGGGGGGGFGGRGRYGQPSHLGRRTWEGIRQGTIFP